MKNIFCTIIIAKSWPMPWGKTSKNKLKIHESVVTLTQATTNVINA